MQDSLGIEVRKEWTLWRSGVKAMSNEPNTYIKLSEFGVKDEDWNFLQNKEIIFELIDMFGPKRCMFASNFPVSSINITFDNLFSNFKKIVQNFSLDEKNLLFSKTAMEAYNINKNNLYN